MYSVGYKLKDVFDVARKNITKWEGGGEHYNPERNTWTAYDDVIGGNIPTVGQGITGKIGGEDIQIGKEYPDDLVGGEYGKRMQGDHDWLQGSIGESWGNLNPNQMAAVISLTHNVGGDAFSKSNAFQHLKRGELDKFAFEAFNPETGFVKAGGKTIPGFNVLAEGDRTSYELHFSKNQPAGGNAHPSLGA